MVIETDGTNSPCRVTRFAGLGTWSILAQQTTTGFFININTSIHSFMVSFELGK